jgi:hypothetical protein
MKNGFLELVKWAFAPAALAVVMAFSPAAAFAEGHGGSHGFSGGRGFSGGHAGGFSGGHSFSAPRGNFGGGHVENHYNGGARFEGGRGFHGGREYYGGHEYYGGRGYYGGGGRGYYRPGFGFGVGVYAPYGYAAPVCDPAGFYDQYGNWQYYPGCAIPPYGY